MLFDEIYDSIIFRHVDKNYVRSLFKGSISVQLKADEFLFHQGIIGRGMYFLVYGSINLLLELKNDEEGKKPHELVISTLKPFSFFGEISFLDECPRTASAKALEKTELIYLDNEILFQGFAQKNINAFQIGTNIGKVMVGHILTMNEKLLGMYKKL